MTLASFIAAVSFVCSAKETKLTLEYQIDCRTWLVNCAVQGPGDLDAKRVSHCTTTAPYAKFGTKGGTIDL